MEVVTSPFIGMGMLLKKSCPHWMSLICCFSEHIIWVHGRTIGTCLSYLPDVALIDGGVGGGSNPKRGGNKGEGRKRTE